MKHLYTLFILALCVCFTGCSDDDENVVKQLKVVSSNVIFEYNGGTGTIEFSSQLPASVETTADWCKASLSNNTVTVTVDANNRAESRSAMVIIKSGDEVTEVPVYQDGEKLITSMKDTQLSDKGEEVTFEYESLLDVKVEGGDSSWLTYTLGNGKLTIKAAMLKAGKRESTISLIAGIHKISATFTQIKGIDGEYDCFADLNGKKGAPFGTCIIEETENKGEYKITPKGSTVDAPYLARINGNEFVINFGQYLGKINDASAPYVYLCAYDAVGRLSWDSKIEYVAPLGVLNEDGYCILTFKDNGTWKDNHVDGFYYGKFTNLLENGGTTTGAGIGPVPTNLVFVQK